MNLVRHSPQIQRLPVAMQLRGQELWLPISKPAQLFLLLVVSSHSSASSIFGPWCSVCCGEAAARAHQEQSRGSWTFLFTQQDPVPAGVLLQEELASTFNGCCTGRGVKNLVFLFSWLLDTSAPGNDADLWSPFLEPPPEGSRKQLLCASHWLLWEEQEEAEPPPATIPHAGRHLSQPFGSLPSSEISPPVTQALGSSLPIIPCSCMCLLTATSPGQGLCWVGRALAIGPPLSTQPMELCCKRKPPQSWSDGGKKDISKCLPTRYDNIRISHWDLELQHPQANKGAVNPFTLSYRLTTACELSKLVNSSDQTYLSADVVNNCWATAI